MDKVTGGCLCGALRERCSELGPRAKPVGILTRGVMGTDLLIWWV